MPVQGQVPGGRQRGEPLVRQLVRNVGDVSSCMTSATVPTQKQQEFCNICKCIIDTVLLCNVVAVQNFCQREANTPVNVSRLSVVRAIGFSDLRALMFVRCKRKAANGFVRLFVRLKDVSTTKTYVTVQGSADVRWRSRSVYVPEVFLSALGAF